MKCRKFYIQLDDPKANTYSFIVCNDNYRGHPEYVYPESSFKAIQGCDSYLNLSDIFKYVAESIFKHTTMTFQLNTRYTVWEFTKDAPYGCTCEEYMNWVKQHGKVVFNDTVQRKLKLFK